MRTACRLIVASLFFAASLCAAAEGKTYPVETTVELSGTVLTDAGYDANDKREEYYYLRLAHPITVAADEMFPQREGVVKIQLVFMVDMDARPFYGKKVSLRGKLFHGHSAHHHTDVLVTIDKAGDISLLPKK